MNVSLRHLKALTLLAETKNFGLAAQKLGISQPALSQAIARLEQTLAVKLIDRTTRSVKLTPYAESIVLRLRYSVAEIEELLSPAGIDKESFSGQVTLSCLSSIALKIMPEVIENYHALHPRIRISVQEDNSSGVVHRVLSGVAEIGICSDGVQNEQLSFSPFLTDQMGVVMRRDHPLSQQEEVRWPDIYPFTLILMSKESGLPKLLRRSGLHGVYLPEASFVASHFGTVIAWILRGLGLGVLPKVAWPDLEDLDLVARPLVAPVIAREVGLIKKRGRTLSKRAQVLAEMIEQTMHNNFK